MGALYEYNNNTGNFDFLSGETLNIGNIFNLMIHWLDNLTIWLFFEKLLIGDYHLPVTYPEEVLTIDGHPELFISNGSHGNWGSPGKHNYLQLVIHLDDYTDRGHEWRFHEQAEIIDYFDTISDDIFALPPNLQFRKFQGRFGNIEEIGCDITEPLFGVCVLANLLACCHSRKSWFWSGPICGQIFRHQIACD